MAEADKPLAWLHGQIKTPPLSKDARIEVGVLLRRLQQGEMLGLPHSRAMPMIGTRCHELRVQDTNSTWRVVYRIDPDAVIVAEVFAKQTQKTPKSVIEACRQRLKSYDKVAEGDRP